MQLLHDSYEEAKRLRANTGKRWTKFQNISIRKETITGKEFMKIFRADGKEEWRFRRIWMSWSLQEESGEEEKQVQQEVPALETQKRYRSLETAAATEQEQPAEEAEVKGGLTGRSREQSRFFCS